MKERYEWNSSLIKTSSTCQSYMFTWRIWKRAETNAHQSD